MFSHSKKRFKKLNPDAISIAIPNTHPEEDTDTNLSGLPLEPLDFLDVEYLGKHTGTWSKFMYLKICYDIAICEQQE